MRFARWGVQFSSEITAPITREGVAVLHKEKHKGDILIAGSLTGSAFLALVVGNTLKTGYDVKSCTTQTTPFEHIYPQWLGVVFLIIHRAHQKNGPQVGWMLQARPGRCGKQQQQSN